MASCNSSTRNLRSVRDPAAFVFANKKDAKKAHLSYLKLRQLTFKEKTLRLSYGNFPGLGSVSEHIALQIIQCHSWLKQVLGQPKEGRSAASWLFRAKANPHRTMALLRAIYPSLDLRAPKQLLIQDLVEGICAKDLQILAIGVSLEKSIWTWTLSGLAWWCLLPLWSGSDKKISGKMQLPPFYV